MNQDKQVYIVGGKIVAEEEEAMKSNQCILIEIRFFPFTGLSMDQRAIQDKTHFIRYLHSFLILFFTASSGSSVSSRQRRGRRRPRHRRVKRYRSRCDDAHQRISVRVGLFCRCRRYCNVFALHFGKGLFGRRTPHPVLSLAG